MTKDNLDIQSGVHVCAFHQQYIKKMDDVCERLRKIEIDKASEDTDVKKTASKLEEVIVLVQEEEEHKQAEWNKLDEELNKAEGKTR